MKTFPQYTKEKKLHSFEINNTFCSRKKATKIVANIPNVKILRRPKIFFSWFREEAFCEFELDGVHFQIDEPFGDNSRYWIGSPQKENSQPIQHIMDAFNIA